VGGARGVLPGARLGTAVAGRGADPYDRGVVMLVARLRRKIEPDPKTPRFILSVPGVGYKFDIRPQSAANGEAPPALERNRSTSPDPERPSQQDTGPAQCRTTAATCDSYHSVRRRRARSY